MRNRVRFESVKEMTSVIRQYSKIRYDKKLNKEIDDTLRRYNNKISRLARERSNFMLPQKVTKDELMELSYTRRDLNRRLSNLRKFNERGAEQTIITKSGYAISKYEMDYLKNEKRRIKSKLTREIKYYEATKPKLWGKETARTFAQMGDSSYMNLLARYEMINKNIEDLPIDELFKYRELLGKIGVDKNYLAENFKLNYLDMITDVGYHVSYDEKKLNKLKLKLMEIDANKFYDLYINEKVIKDLANYYYVTIDGKRDPKNFKEDVSSIYDSLLENIDFILKDYI